MPRITREQAALAAIQILSGKQTLEQTNLTPEMALAVRKLVAKTFNMVASKSSDPENSEALPDEKSELVGQLNLGVHYGTNLSVLRHYGFLAEEGEANGHAKPPSFEKVMESFELEELEIATGFQEPTLLLIPENSFAAKVRALDSHKKGMLQEDTTVDEFFLNPESRREFDAASKLLNEESDPNSAPSAIRGWRAVIVDGAQEIKDNRLELKLGERIDIRTVSRQPGEKGMNKHVYAMLMMMAIRNGDPIDTEKITVLDDELLLPGSKVPYAHFSPDEQRVNFSYGDPIYAYANVRFRSSVGGDKLL